jgi:hypothetical protein
MKFVTHSHDLSHAHTLIYHLPNGETLEINIDDNVHLLEFGLEYGRICNTAEIDGIIHFFPLGHS